MVSAAFTIPEPIFLTILQIPFPKAVTPDQTPFTNSQANALTAAKTPSFFHAIAASLNPFQIPLRTSPIHKTTLPTKLAAPARTPSKNLSSPNAFATIPTPSVTVPSTLLINPTTPL